MALHYVAAPHDRPGHGCWLHPDKMGWQEQTARGRPCQLVVLTAIYFSLSVWVCGWGWVRVRVCVHVCVHISLVVRNGCLSSKSVMFENQPAMLRVAECTCAPEASLVSGMIHVLYALYVAVAELGWLSVGWTCSLHTSVCVISGADASRPVLCCAMLRC